MKYLDEYRDAAAAEKLAAAIARTVTRPWTIMEVCGGQTHTIVKYGIDTILPAGGRAGARAGLPGLRHLAGDDRPGARDRLAAGGHLLLVRRHAPRARLARRPAAAQVARERRAGRLLAARRREPGGGQPRPQVVFFAIGFETTAPPNAMAVWLAQRAQAGELQRAGLARARAADDRRPSSRRRTTASRGSSGRATSAP